MPAVDVKTTPGVFLEQVFRSPDPTLDTGVPAFLGLVDATDPAGKAAGDALFAAQTATPGVAAIDLMAWSRLEATVGAAWAGGNLGFAVRGFFQNGGRRCYVVAPGAGGLAAGIAALDAVDDFDLVCAPDLATVPSTGAMTSGQAALARFCDDRGGCLAILDSVGAPAPSALVDLAAAQTHLAALREAIAVAGSMGGMNAALYAPWIKVGGACPTCGGTGLVASATCPICAGTGAGFVPPCGHVAGVCARTDQRVGVHKAPANEVLQGVIDLQLRVDDAAQATWNPLGINGLRAFPGRGTRIWGARTLSTDDAWRYVNVRRLVLTIGRWLALNLASVAFEPNDLRLWVRIGREVGAYLDRLFQQGALQGSKAEEAFLVKCDDETNPPAVRDAGMVVTEVSVAPARPSEFVVVRLVSGAAGASVSTSP